MEEHRTIKEKPELDSAFQEKLRRLLEMKELLASPEYTNYLDFLEPEKHSVNKCSGCSSCSSCGGGGGSCSVTGGEWGAGRGR